NGERDCNLRAQCTIKSHKGSFARKGGALELEEFWSRCRRLLPAAGALFLLAVFQPLAHAADSLVWAADAEGGAPYIFKDPDNPQRDIGFEVDLANALANQLGRTIEFKQYEYISLFLGLDRGDFDFAMNG